MCAISINLYDWDLSESDGKRPELTPLPHMQLWSLFHTKYIIVIAVVADYDVTFFNAIVERFLSSDIKKNKLSTFLRKP